MLREQHVVGGVAVEGRVQVDEVDGLVGDVAPQNVEVVAVVQEIAHGAKAIIATRRTKGGRTWGSS